jgi:hypothetical protein
MLGMMYRTFSHFTPELLKIVYSTFVRPHLEFAIAACNPYSLGDINKLEKVQRRATRLPPAIRNLDYSQRLHVLGLTPLHTRRIRGDLIQTYKLVNGLESVTLSTASIFSAKKSEITTRGHSQKLSREVIKSCDQRHHFFSNRVVPYWNNLPEHVVSASSTNSFKARLDREISVHPSKFT